jgi:hypothetical protein
VHCRNEGQARRFSNRLHLEILRFRAGFLQ